MPRVRHYYLVFEALTNRSIWDILHERSRFDICLRMQYLLSHAACHCNSTYLLTKYRIRMNIFSPMGILASSSIEGAKSARTQKNHAFRLDTFALHSYLEKVAVLDLS